LLSKTLSDWQSESIHAGSEKSTVIAVPWPSYASPVVYTKIIGSTCETGQLIKLV
jgi:hypothetical protein